MIPAMQEIVLSYLTCKASMFGEAHWDPDDQVRSALHSQQAPTRIQGDWLWAPGMAAALTPFPEDLLDIVMATTLAIQCGTAVKVSTEGRLCPKVLQVKGTVSSAGNTKESGLLALCSGDGSCLQCPSQRPCLLA